MTRDEVRAAAKRVIRWHERFAGLFGRKEPQGHSLVYVKGLMSQQKRKSVEPIALQFARGPHGAAATQNEVVALQGFLTHSPWEAIDAFGETLAMVTSTRFRVEEYFQDGKTHLGMADYEARAWTSWHHHMALVALAHLYVTLTKRDVKHDIPDLTLDMAMRILRAAFAKPTLSDEEAIKLIDYHLERNKVAQESHRKTWLAKHLQLAGKVLL